MQDELDVVSYGDDVYVCEGFGGDQVCLASGSTGVQTPQEVQHGSRISAHAHTNIVTITIILFFPPAKTHLLHRELLICVQQANGTVCHTSAHMVTENGHL